MNSKIQDIDADGFHLIYEADTQPDERAFFLQQYPYVDAVVLEKLHCTSCQTHIGSAPTKESVICMHPILRTTQCKKCYNFYNSGEFDKGEDGSELYCRWCGQGGEVFCCSDCPFVFCKKCILSNLSKNFLSDVMSNDNWKCFRCEPTVIWKVRARHWALVNYIERAKKKILAIHKDSDDICTAMNTDSSTCCRKRTVSKRRRRRSSETTTDSESDENATKKITKSGSVVSSKVLPAADIIVSKNKLNDIVCTPDILSMFEVNSKTKKTTVTLQKTTTPAVTVSSSLRVLNAELTKQSNPRSANNGDKTFTVSNGPCEVDRQVISVKTPGTNPVYHTINGYRIDLNTAARQDTFRLPNGKLIQVKKQSTVPKPPVTSTVASVRCVSTPAIAPAPRPVVRARPSRDQIPQLSTGANITPVPFALFNPQQPLPHMILPTFSSSSSSLPNVPHNSTPPPPNVSHNSTQPPPPLVLNNTTLRNMLLPPILPTRPVGNHHTAVRPATFPLPTAPPPSSATLPIAASNPQPAPLQRVRTAFPNTPVGKARSDFENDVFAAQDLSRHIHDKLSTMMKSNAYKSANSFADVKELHIHLSYLFTYILSRFQSLQEKSLRDTQNLVLATKAAISAADKKANYVNDEDDLRVVEPTQTCIEIDSDEEEAQTATTSNASSPPSGILTHNDNVPESQPPSTASTGQENIVLGSDEEEAQTATTNNASSPPSGILTHNDNVPESQPPSTGSTEQENIVLGSDEETDNSNSTTPNVGELGIDNFLKSQSRNQIRIVRVEHIDRMVNRSNRKSSKNASDNVVSQTSVCSDMNRHSSADKNRQQLSGINRQQIASDISSRPNVAGTHGMQMHAVTPKLVKSHADIANSVSDNENESTDTIIAIVDQVDKESTNDSTDMMLMDTITHIAESANNTDLCNDPNIEKSTDQQLIEYPESSDIETLDLDFIEDQVEKDTSSCSSDEVYPKTRNTITADLLNDTTSIDIHSHPLINPGLENVTVIDSSDDEDDDTGGQTVIPEKLALVMGPTPQSCIEDIELNFLNDHTYVA